MTTQQTGQYTPSDVLAELRAGGISYQQAIALLERYASGSGVDATAWASQYLEYNGVTPQNPAGTWTDAGGTATGNSTVVSQQSGGIPVSPLTTGKKGTPLTQAPLTQQREQIFREQEEKQGGIPDAFRQFLATSPQYGALSGLGRRALESQYSPALSSFTLQGPQAGPTGEALTFRDFLQGGGQIMSPVQQRQRLSEIGSLFGVPEEGLTGQQQGLVGKFRENDEAFNAYLQATLGSVHPIFRNAIATGAQNVFDRFSAQTPERSFLPWVTSRRGGFFGG